MAESPTLVSLGVASSGLCHFWGVASSGPVFFWILAHREIWGGKKDQTPCTAGIHQYDVQQLITNHWSPLN